MNNTAVCKFCTLKEAAERLHVTEDQIESLLRKGILREFRVGSHRLLRTADVGAIAAARKRRLERQGQSRMSGMARPACAERDGTPAAGPTGPVRVPRPLNTTSQAPRRDVPRPASVNEVPRRSEPGSRRRAPVRSGKSPLLSDGFRAPRSRAAPEALPPRPSMSIREWFWTGLIQDRPEAIALLSGLALLALSAVVAGICALADML